MQMYAILEKVFNLTVINDEEQLRVLTLFSLLADNTAVTILKLKEWFGTNNNNSLNKLVRNGWLSEDEGKGIYIHPVIAEVVRKKQKPDFGYAEGMIRKLVKEIQGTEIVKEKNDILPHLMSIEKGIEKKESHTMAVLYNNIGYQIAVDVSRTSAERPQNSASTSRITKKEQDNLPQKLMKYSILKDLITNCKIAQFQSLQFVQKVELSAKRLTIP